jgi:hypothetical protein
MVVVYYSSISLERLKANREYEYLRKCNFFLKYEGIFATLEIKNATHRMEAFPRIRIEQQGL